MTNDFGDYAAAGRDMRDGRNYVLGKTLGPASKIVAMVVLLDFPEHVTVRNFW